MSKRIFTIGHSTRTWDEFIAVLQAHAIQQLADVRSFPGSRRHPHFARQHLEATLPQLGIAYRWLPDLGGHRKPSSESSPNQAWRVAGFRAYADYMQTTPFETALAGLEDWALRGPTAFMCAEALYSKCHRQLLSDALVVRGWRVLHLTSKAAPLEHVMTAFASVDRTGRLTYPGNARLALDED